VDIPPGLGLRAGIVAASLAAWFASQRLLSLRPPAAGTRRDPVLDATARLHGWFAARPRAADAALIASSAGIDLLGLGLLGAALLGPTFRPFLALAVVFAMRQASQALVSLPAPPGMIWRDPGFPSLLVTYRTSHDFFFSGHTAIAVLAALEAARSGPPALAVAVAAAAAAEAAAVIVLRAHWTMDVVAGALAAAAGEVLASAWAPGLDAWIRGPG
jgi:hypothetical protein